MRFTSKILSLIFLGWGPGATAGFVIGFLPPFLVGLLAWKWDGVDSAIFGAIFGVLGLLIGFALSWWAIGNLFDLVWAKWFAAAPPAQARHEEVVGLLTEIRDRLPTQVTAELAPPDAPPAD